jgi:predicted AAA+ superfamily ATPase
MSESFLVYEIAQFSYKIKHQIKSKRKIYCIDNGLISAVSLNFSENKGQLFENLVFSELIKFGCKEIFFYTENKECDFIIRVKNKLIAIQACFEINNRNQEREIAGIEEVMKKLSIDRSYIITFSQSEQQKLYISTIPVYEMYKIFE